MGVLWLHALKTHMTFCLHSHDWLGGFHMDMIMYDVHRIFDPLPLLWPQFILFICKFAAFLKPPSPFCTDVIYGSPLH